jgi:hypothetical protein
LRGLIQKHGHARTGEAGGRAASIESFLPSLCKKHFVPLTNTFLKHGAFSLKIDIERITSLYT